MSSTYGGTKYKLKSAVIKKNLNPVWNFRVLIQPGIETSDNQTGKIKIRIWDKDKVIDDKM